MILYSIVPWEVVFKNNNEKTIERYIEMDYLGEKVLATPAGENRYVINRIISTSPRAYLNPRLQPGQYIEARIETGKED